MGASLGQRHGDTRTLEVREATIRGFSSGGHGDPGDFGDTGGSHEGFLQGQGNGDTETGEVHVRGFSRRNMSTLGHNRDSHQGFHWGGTWGHWGKGGGLTLGASPGGCQLSPRSPPGCRMPGPGNPAGLGTSGVTRGMPIPGRPGEQG